MARLFQPLIERDWNLADLQENLFEANADADEIPENEQQKADTDPSPRVWIAKTLLKGREDRQTGPHRLGEALWSPQASKIGGDIYANMRKVQPGDIVLHLTNNSGPVAI